MKYTFTETRLKEILIDYLSDPINYENVDGYFMLSEENEPIFVMEIREY